MKRSTSVPETDEQVKDIIFGGDQLGIESSQWLLYIIYRERDQMTIEQAWEKLLLTSISLLFGI
jgi:hypothetical protein